MIMDSLKICVVIPTLNPNAEFHGLIRRLQHQSVPVTEIVIVDSGSDQDKLASSTNDQIRVHTILPSDFDHGGTRNLGASLAQADILVFMTQDAIPKDETLIERLTAPIRDGRASASFARQVAKSDANPVEVATRDFNYPAVSSIKSLADRERLGVKTFFFSNVCSAVSAKAFLEVDGFPERTIMNEDMILAARLLESEHSIAYVSDAVVLHSHNYSWVQQFRRNFDIGAFFAMNPKTFGDFKIGGEGLRLVRHQLRIVTEKRAWLSLAGIPWEATAKLLGFQIGKRFTSLPGWLRKQLSMHRKFWNQQ
jgi:rhamnosyltransferase